MGFWKRIGSWKISEVIYKNGRNFCQRTGITKHSGRQNFHIGWLTKNKKSALLKHLKKQGFEKDPYAWIDADEVFSMRKLAEDKYQYHIRLHKDGELRGHYEYAPDSKPLKHYESRYFRKKGRYFRKLLKGFLR
tara:strand:- start:210 stop:611 length:402 start_codon:yes stop_codon:yes gene_type:complete